MLLTPSHRRLRCLISAAPAGVLVVAALSVQGHRQLVLPCRPHRRLGPHRPFRRAGIVDGRLRRSRQAHLRLN